MELVMMKIKMMELNTSARSKFLQLFYRNPRYDPRRGIGIRFWNLSSSRKAESRRVK